MKKRTTVTIKNTDGSVLSVKIADITDPVLKKEIEILDNSAKIKINGPIVKKKV